MSIEKGKRILLVEDTITQSLIMQHLLESHDCQVLVARDGHKALQLLESNAPDLILSDVSMPEMDGYELCRRVKSNPGTRDIPFVLLSSFHDPAEITDVVNCGADSFILKRFDEKYIFGALQDVLLTRRQEKTKGSWAPPAGAAETVTISCDGVLRQLEGDREQIASMLFSAFRTVVHLLPFVQEE